MSIPYRPNEQDKAIIADITNHIKNNLNSWYGKGTFLDTEHPEIRSYRNSIMLIYPTTRSVGTKKTILVKIRRNPKMDSIWRALKADIHTNTPIEYSSLEFVFSYLKNNKGDFGVIRPLDYMEKYRAIFMEEYPSRTLRDILIENRSSKNGQGLSKLMDVATKTGRWLHYFHHNIHTPVKTPYTVKDMLELVQEYARRLEAASHGRVNAQNLMDVFSERSKNVHLESLPFSHTHADMTCDNVLYSEDGRVCIIDIKTRKAPIYSDLGLILTHPETFKSQIFSGGAYLPESLLKGYRAAILSGYFENESGDATLVQLFSAIKVLDKWTMYEELMNRYKGVKYLLSFPVGPYVTSYFQNVFRKHLDLIETDESVNLSNLEKPVDPAARSNSNL